MIERRKKLRKPVYLRLIRDEQFGHTRITTAVESEPTKILEEELHPVPQKRGAYRTNTYRAAVTQKHDIEEMVKEELSLLDDEAAKKDTGYDPYNKR